MSVGETIRDVVLRITGDGDDAKRELERLSLELTKFGQKDAEASAEINTAKAKADLKALEAQFARIDGRDLTATANVRLGKAKAELAMLQAQLDEIDGRDVEIDVEVQKDLEDRLQGLAMKAAGFADTLGDVERRSTSAGKSIADTNVNFFNMNTRLGSLLKIAPALIPIIVGLGAQIVALGASAVQAIGGLAALAVAMGGALAAAASIGVAAFFRFKETMEQAGTPAYKIVQIVGQIGDALSGLSKAADPILHAIANNLSRVFDVIEKVRPAFFALGKEAGQAVSWMVKALTSSDMASGISKLLELAGPVMKPLAQIFVRFGHILLNIANAAMPFLTSALQDLARWLGEAVKGTSDMLETRGAIGQMVSHLQSWWHLLVQITGVFGELVRIAGPFGQGMVDSLAKGAEHLREWLSSKEGTERVKQFFEDVLPLASEVAEMVGKLMVLFVQFGQLMAPVIKPFVAGINEGLSRLIAFQELLMKIPAPIRALIGTLLAFAFGFNTLKVAGAGVRAALSLLVGVLGVVGGAFSGLWEVISNVVGKIPGFISDRFGNARDAAVALTGALRDGVIGAWSAIRDVAGDIWGAMRDRIRDRIQSAREAVATAVRATSDVARAAWQGIREAASTIFNSIREAITNRIQSARESLANTVRTMSEVARNVWQGIREAATTIFGNVREAIANALGNAREAVGNAVRAMADVARNVWQSIRDAAATIFNGVKDAIANALGNAREAVVNIVQAMLGVFTGITGRFYAAGQALIQNMIDGFMSLANSLYDKIKSVADKATDLLPGSEPKDKTSPFYGLKKRGAAILGNLMAGIESAGPDFVDALSKQLSAAAMVGPPQMAIAGGVGIDQTAHEAQTLKRVAASIGGGGSSKKIHQEINVTPIAGGGSPDPDVLASQLSFLLRAKGA
jgi:phage-related protein